MKLMRISRMLPLLVLVTRAWAQGPPPARVWLSGGLGYSSLGWAGVASASLSNEARIITYRGGSTAGSDVADQLADRALLVGVRTKASRFVLAEIGIARVRRWNSSRRIEQPRRTAVAFDVSAIRAGETSAIGLSAFGAIGAGTSSYAGLVMTLSFGWFGRDDAAGAPN